MADTKYEDIPVELKRRKQWVVWGVDKKAPKKPYNPVDMQPAKANDPTTWGIYRQAVERVEKGEAEGIGFEFSNKDPYVGIDFDNCLEYPEQSQLQGIFGDIHREVKGYSEISPSGKGVHIIVKGKKPGAECKKVINSSKGEAVEIYENGRYFTITGNVWSRAEVIYDHSEEINKWYNVLFSEKPTKTTVSKSTGTIKPTHDLEWAITHDKVLMPLWNGERPNDNESSDDMGLMNKLAYYCAGDAEQMTQKFKESPHYKSKDASHKRKCARKDYLPRTIEEAIAGINGDSISCNLINLKDVAPEKVDWLWYPYIPLGKITAMQGDPGSGKTFLSCMIASLISNGGDFISDNSSDEKREPAIVIFQNAEDGVADTIKPRLMKMKPDFSNIYIIDETDKSLTLSDARIEAALQQVHPALFVIDPIQAYLGRDVDMHRANEVRPILARIGQLAVQYQCAFLLVMHMNKGGNGKALYRALGSIDIVGAARSLLMVGANPDNPEQKIMAHVKSSLAISGESIAFHIDENEGVVFEGYSDITSDQLANSIKKEHDKPSLLDNAIELIENCLGDKGYATRENIKRAFEVANISKNTMYRAKDELKLKRISKGFQPKITYWINDDLSLDDIPMERDESS